MIENNFINNSSDTSSNCSPVTISKFKKPINYVTLIGDRFVYNNNNQLVNLGIRLVKINC